jgi:hypothetical protein
MSADESATLPPALSEPPPPAPPAGPAASRPAGKSENLLLNLVCNVAIPTAVLTWLSGARAFGPRWGLVVALAFPLSYGLVDFARRRRCNFVSVIGFASVLISGGFGLMKVDGFWFAVKDAAIPSIIGLAVLASSRAKEPLVGELLYNPQVIDVEKVDARLAVRGARVEFGAVLRRFTALLSLTFFISAALNFMLARHILRSPPGTESFNGELAKMQLMSWPVIVLPSMVMMMLVFWRLLHGIKALTGLELHEIFQEPPAKNAEPGAASPE